MVGKPEPSRIVSLVPAITETLFAIGAGASVVGVSDYCDAPPEAAELPHLGSWLNPSWEKLVALSPTLVLTERDAAAPIGRLRAVAPARELAWLSLDDVRKSIGELGELTGHQREAQKLAASLVEVLSRAPPPDAPRVLLTLADLPGKLENVWFIQDNSLHGAALRAAGGRNAISGPITGSARLSLEQVLEVDPDLVIMLVRREQPSSELSGRFLRDWQKLNPLRAVLKGKVGVLMGPNLHRTGPSILEFVTQLRGEIQLLTR
jgi:iron complex transport system substrate-binding protein